MSDLKPTLDTSRNQTNRNGPDAFNLDGYDLPNSRPMSPLTLALRCDEQDAMFVADGSSNGLTNHGHLSSLQLPDQSSSEVYAEQERIVLTVFRDCLNRIITLGKSKGKSHFNFVWHLVVKIFCSNFIIIRV